MINAQQLLLRKVSKEIRQRPYKSKLEYCTRKLKMKLVEEEAGGEGERQ